MPTLINGNYAYDIFDNYPTQDFTSDHPMTLTSLSGHAWWTKNGDGGWTWREHAQAGSSPDVFSMPTDPTGFLVGTTPHCVALLDPLVYNCRIIIGFLGGAAGVAFRSSHAGGDWEGYYTDILRGSPTSVLRIIKREAGVESIVATSGAFTISNFAGDEASVLDVRPFGDTVKVYVDGALVVTYTDSWHMFATECGVVSSAGTDDSTQYAGVLDIYVRPPLVPIVCGAMDICLILDHTGSMDRAINPIKDSVVAVMDDIEAASGGDYRLALITVDDPIEVIETFAPLNRAAVSAGIVAITDGAGRGLPEATDEAIHTAITLRAAADVPTLSYFYTRPGVGTTNVGQWGDFNVAWRDGVIKIIVIVTDAPPAGFDDECVWDVDIPRAASFAVMAAAQDIHIVSIMVPDSGPFSVWQRGISYTGHDYADITHGVFGRIASTGLGAGEAVREAILACGGQVRLPAMLAQIAG